MQMELGKKIRVLRLEKGLTLPELADKAKVSKGFLFQIETDEETNPSLDTLHKVASALDVTLAELLEKESVKARRLVPAEIDETLKEFLSDARKAGQIIPEETLQALYVLQHRKGRAPKTKEDWRYLYETIERVFKGK
jgi:transcriptional regulator with XRE-family HTH domain